MILTVIVELVDTTTQNSVSPTSPYWLSEGATDGEETQEPKPRAPARGR